MFLAMLHQLNIKAIINILYNDPVIKMKSAECDLPNFFFFTLYAFLRLNHPFSLCSIMGVGQVMLIAVM